LVVQISLAFNLPQLTDYKLTSPLNANLKQSGPITKFKANCWQMPRTGLCNSQGTPKEPAS